MSQRNLAWLIVVPAVVLFTGVFTFTAPPPEQDYKMVRTVVDVLAEVDKSYYRELTAEEKKKLVEDMINGGLHSLDPYAEYFNEERLKQFSDDNKGTFGGIGVYLDVDARTGLLKIDNTSYDSPAAEKGLLADDLIAKIDGAGTGDMSVDDARGKIKGEPGTSVTLTIRRAGVKEPFDVTVTRRAMQTHPVKGFRRKPEEQGKWDYFADPENKIALIRLAEFNETSGKEVEAAVKEVVAAGAKGLVLDMRGNPGGLLRVAEHISDLFLADGFIVRTRDRHNTGRDVKAKKDGTAWEDAGKLPMAVLVDRQSASAAEIVAAALQDNGRAVVVGERSYGKGSVQRSIESPDGKSALKLTTEKWFTPKERNIDRPANGKAKPGDTWGVDPDDGFEVKITEEQLWQLILHMREAEMPRKASGEAPKEPEAKPDPSKPKRPELPKLDPNFKDPVLEKALEHLRAKAKTALLRGLLRGPA